MSQPVELAHLPVTWSSVTPSGLFVSRSAGSARLADAGVAARRGVTVRRARPSRRRWFSFGAAINERGNHMDYQKPEIADFGDISGHTYINAGGENKGQPGHDPFGEISVKDNGGS
jgi:hypothetical protein